MSISLVLASLRRALPALPVEWALWSMDAEGVLLAHEGPGAPRVEAVGRSVWEVYRGEEALLAFASRVLREPSAAEVVARGARIHLAGAPVAEGGAVGMATVLDRLPEEAAVEAAVEAELPPSVMELLHPVPEIGAETGDLLLWSPGRPEAVGLYRDLPASRLPEAVARDLRLIRSRSSAAAGSGPPAPSPAGASRPLRERAAHLRVVS